MRIYHIKDNYMFNKKNHNGTHRYAVYKDRKTHETRVIQLTHLYEIPYNKKNRLNNGWIKEYKLSCYKLPSGIETGYRTKDINGNPIQLNNSNSKPSYSLSKKESIRIKNIARRKFK